MVEHVHNNEATNEESAQVAGANQDEDIRPFTDIKARVEDTIDNVVRRHFSNKQYEPRQMQSLVNTASEEIIK